MNRAYLAPLGSLDEEVLFAIESSLQQTFGFETCRMNALDEPRYAFDAGRRQFSSAQILKELVRHNPGNSKILGITEVDLFIPTLSFVFGQAQLDGCAAIISLARLRQEFYRLPANPGLMMSRARKESIHELGHTLGLTHCPEPGCPMSISTGIRQVDMKGEVFCNTCAAQLHELWTTGGNQGRMRR